MIRATAPGSTPFAINTGPSSGAAIPSPPEAEPHIPAITVVPIASPSVAGPGMSVIALTTVSNAAAPFTTEPKPTTAQVFVIENTVLFIALPSSFEISAFFIKLCIRTIVSTVPIKSPVSRCKIFFPSAFLRFIITTVTISGINAINPFGRFSFELKTSPSLATK